MPRHRNLPFATSFADAVTRHLERVTFGDNPIVAAFSLAFDSWLEQECLAGIPGPLVVLYTVKAANTVVITVRVTLIFDTSLDILPWQQGRNVVSHHLTFHAPMLSFSELQTAPAAQLAAQADHLAHAARVLAAITENLHLAAADTKLRLIQP